MLCFRVTAQIGNTQTELKKLAEQNPELKDAYLAKQRRLKVRKANRVPKKPNCCRLLFTLEIVAKTCENTATDTSKLTKGCALFKC